MKVTDIAGQSPSLDVMWSAYQRSAQRAKAPTITIGHAFLNARYYDSARGQFLSQDPVFLVIGTPQTSSLVNQTNPAILANPQQLNAYSYSHDNPITSKDPKGLLGPDTPFEAALATPAGIILGAVGQASRDYAAGQLSPIEDYWGSEFGGAVGLNLALDTDGIGIPLSSAVGSGAGNAATQLLKNLTGSQKGVSVGSALTDTAFGYAFGFVPDVSLLRTAFGSQMYSATTKSLIASLTNKLAAITVTLGRSVIKGSPSTVSQGITQGVLSRLQNVLTNLNTALSSPKTNATQKKN